MAYTLICRHCGASFSDSHKTRKCCSYTCAAKSRNRKPKQLFTYQCLHCNKTFSTRYSEPRKFCSPHCGYAHRKSEGRSCLICGKRFFLPPSQAHVKHCSTKCGHASKTSSLDFQCLNCGKSVSKRPFVAKKSRFCSMNCYRKFRGETKPEKQVREVLENLTIKFIKQYAVGLYNIDFYLPDQKIALEVDGAYWHQKQLEQDKKRDSVLLSKGITTIRITDKELYKSNPVEVVFTKLLRGS